MMKLLTLKNIFGDDFYCDPDEKWKRMTENDNYFISDTGRVYSTISGRFVTGYPIGRCGHIDMSLRDSAGKRQHVYLHRAIANAFIPNPNNYPIVRHLNDVADDNELSNLAWGTQTDNVRDCIENGNFSYFSREDIQRANDVRRMPIKATNLKTGESQTFKSQQEASRVLHFKQGSISEVVHGKSKTLHGYTFEEVNK